MSMQFDRGRQSSEAEEILDMLPRPVQDFVKAIVSAGAHEYDVNQPIGDRPDLYSIDYSYFSKQEDKTIELAYLQVSIENGEVKSFAYGIITSVLSYPCPSVVKGGRTDFASVHEMAIERIRSW